MATTQVTTDVIADGAITAAKINLGGPLAGFRNRIINGACHISQRGNVAAVNNSYTYGGCDRIVVAPSGFTTASGTIQQNTSVGFQSPFAQQLASVTTTGSGNIQFVTKIESKDVIDLNSKTITISANFYQDTGGAINGNLQLYKATAFDNFVSVTQIGSTTTISIPNMYNTKMSATFTLGSTDASNGLMMLASFGTVGAVTSKNFMIGDWQMEIGTVATPLEFCPFAMELARCQRYYERKTINGAYGSGYANTGTANLNNVVVPWNVPKRIPGVTANAAAVGNFTVFGITANAYTLTANDFTFQFTSISAASGSVTQWDCGTLQGNGSSYIEGSAEL